MGIRIKIAMMVGVVLAGLLAVVGSLDLKYERKGDLDLIYGQLNVLTNSLLKSLMHDMIEGDSTGVQVILESVATEPGIVSISIFSEDGRVLRSSERETVGSFIGQDVLDHYREGRLRYVDEDTDGGYGVYRIVRAINNGPSCHGCHDKAREVIGVIALDYSLEGIDDRLGSHRFLLVITYLLTVTFGGAFIFMALDRMAVRPVIRIKDAMREAELGNMDLNVPVETRDEIGALAEGFNMMLARISELTEENMAQQRSELIREQEFRVRHALEAQNRALEELNRDGAEKNRRYMEMLGFISEDMKSPLAMVRGYLEMMLGGELGDLGEGQLEALGSMQRNLAQLQSMLDNYTILSAMEKGQVVPQLREADLISEVVEPVMAEFSDELKRYDMGLKVVTSAEAVVVRMDTSLMSSALGNLVANAVRFGKRRGDIEINVELEGDEVVLSVYNTGRGIPASQLERIFERFTRVEYGQGEGRGMKSAGLGLYIVRQVVSLHGGTVAAESSEGDWFRVICRLPLDGTKG